MLFGAVCQAKRVEILLLQVGNFSLKLRKQRIWYVFFFQPQLLNQNVLFSHAFNVQHSLDMDLNQNKGQIVAGFRWMNKGKGSLWDLSLFVSCITHCNVAYTYGY